MDLRLHRPGSALAPHVTLLWHFTSPGTAHARERVLPDGTAALVINLRDDVFTLHDPSDPGRTERRRGMLFVGPRTACDVIDTCGPQTLMGVCFAPGGAAAFLPMPVGEVSGQQIDLAAIWGDRAEELRLALRETRSVDLRLRMLERALLRARMGGVERHPAVAFALHAFEQPASPDVGTVVERTGWSHRRFIDLFVAQVGLTPKAYQRVRRFQRVVRTLHPALAPDLADIAAACGYCDQAHFTHDFRAFAGLTPSAYLACRGAHPNHAAVA